MTDASPRNPFSDIAPARNPDIAHIGMVTAAAWADLEGLGHPQLLITGEWMAPRLFDFQKIGRAHV